MNAAKFRRAFSLWFPAAAYTAFIFWLSSAPRRVPWIGLFPHIDKVYHLAEYAPLGCLLSRAVRGTFGRMRWLAVGVWVLITVAGVGGLDEFYQSFIDTRISSAWDALADLIGGALGFLLYRRRTAKTP